MRTMEKNGMKINVVEHIIVKNFWEYYVTDEDTGENDIKFCLVMGHETELGDVWMPELQPFIITKTKHLKEVMPASGWNWVD